MALSDIQEKWERRINDAQKTHEDWHKQFKVNLARDYFEGKQNPGDAEWITINKVYSHLMAQLPQLYSVDPYFYVKLKRSYTPSPQAVAAYEQKGKIRQAYLNYLKGELELKQKARLGIQDAHFAYGVVKVHYSADQQKNPSAGEYIYAENGDPMMDDDGEFLTEPETLPINEKYNITRVHPDDFVWDADAGPLADSWCWVAERIKLTKEQAQADPRISMAALKGAEYGPRDRDAQNDVVTGKPREEGKDNDVYTLWEIYDIRKKEWLLIAEGAEKPIIKPSPLPAGTECHPYSILRFTLRDKSAYPIPPISQGIDIQREYNEARTKVMKHRKRFNRKYEVFVQGMEDPDMELAKLESGEDGTILRKQTPQRVVEPINDAPLDQQTYTEILTLNNDLVELFGASDAARGIARSDSATEAALIDKRLEVREGDRMSMVIEWVADIAKKLDKLVQANISRDEAVRVVGPEGEMWQLVSTDDYDEIAGEYEYSVNVGATMPRLPQVERSQWLAFLQVVGSFPQLLTVKSLLKRMAEMHHIEDDQMIDDLVHLGQQLMGMQQQQAAAKGQGSAQGVPTNNPIAAAMGMAMGDRGGLVNGGGAPGIG